MHFLQKSKYAKIRQISNIFNFDFSFFAAFLLGPFIDEIKQNSQQTYNVY